MVRRCFEETLTQSGGGRFGEMEVCALEAHGASWFLRERLLISSDGVDVAFCKECGSQAKRTAGVPFSELVCARKTCDSRAFAVHKVPFAFLLLRGELLGVGIGYYFYASAAEAAP